ncbi:MAG: DMT family transporter [Desulfovibrio sp.]|nr:DMT family transporter [Desulfovibrio sp.]
MNTDTRAAGYVLGLISSAAFGMIPLFTLPIMRAGIPAQTALVYRFVIASIIMGVILKLKGEKFSVSPLALLKLFFLSSMYLLAVAFFFSAFSFMSSGAAATIQFLYPVMVMLIMIFFFHERFDWRVGLAVILAVAGVALLSLGPGLEPALDENSARAARPPFGSDLFWGVTLSLLAGLCNGLYFVGIQVASLPKITGLVMTFYVMVFGSFFCLGNALLSSSLVWMDGAFELFMAFMLALITAVISNLTLIMAIRRVGSTLASILGVMEPLTAVIAGILVFGEAFTLQLMVGVVLVLISVILVVLNPSKKQAEN